MTMPVSTADQITERFLRICRQSAQTLLEAAKSYDSEVWRYPEMAANCRAQAAEYGEVIARLEAPCRN